MLRNKCLSDNRHSEYYTVPKESFSCAGSKSAPICQHEHVLQSFTRITYEEDEVLMPVSTQLSRKGRNQRDFNKESNMRHEVLLQFPLHQPSVFLPFSQLLRGALKESLQKSVTCSSMIWAVLKLESHLHQYVFVRKEKVRRYRAGFWKCRILLMLLPRVALLLLGVSCHFGWVIYYSRSSSKSTEPHLDTFSYQLIF